jgi:DNA gyrase/topoisomerase IV subunit B
VSPQRDVSDASLESIKKKNKAAPVKPFQVKNHMWIFVNALIENPAFDSQTKETLTLKSSAFGSKCELSEDFVKKGKFQVGQAHVSCEIRNHRQCVELGEI